jgi:hypothetical protein
MKTSPETSSHTVLSYSDPFHSYLLSLVRLLAFAFTSQPLLLGAMPHRHCSPCPILAITPIHYTPQSNVMQCVFNAKLRLKTCVSTEGLPQISCSRTRSGKWRDAQATCLKWAMNLLLKKVQGKTKARVFVRRYWLIDPQVTARRCFKYKTM